MNSPDHLGIQPATGHNKENSIARSTGIEVNQGPLANSLGQAFRGRFEV